MRGWRGLWERIRVLLSRSRFEQELDEELEFHLERATERNVARGMSEPDARRAARLALGGKEVAKEKVRDETGTRWITDWIQDSHLGLRNLRRRPMFAVILLMTVTLCVAANSAVFSVVYAILLRPLPFPDSDRIVRIYNSYPAADVVDAGVSIPDYFDRRAGIDGLEEVAVYTEISKTLGEGDGGRHVFSMSVTPSFFSVFKARPVVGSLLPEDLERGVGANVVVMGYRLWANEFGSDPGIVGTTVLLDDVSHTVLGVLPPDYRFATWDAQLYTPLVFSNEARGPDNRHEDNFHMVATLREGASVATVQSQIAALNAALVADYPADLRRMVSDAGYRTDVRPYLADMTKQVRTPLMLLWAGALAVLLAGVANVSTLFLVRARTRRNEFSYRLALGASRGRIVRQLLTESSLVAIIGGALGLMLAAWSLSLLQAFEVYEIPRVDDVHVSYVVVALGVVMTLILGAVMGLVPARSVLTGNGGGLSRNARGHTNGSGRAHRVLVGAQIAMAFMLVVDAGLLVRSTGNLTAIDPGFEPEGVAVAATTLTPASFPTREQRVAAMDRIEASLVALPSVEAAAFASQLPFSGSDSRSVVISETGRPDADVQVAYSTAVSENYFEVLGIPLLSGRAFEESDDASSRRVAVVDRDFGRRMWPNRNPVGRRFWSDGSVGSDEDAYEVVGVVDAIKQNGLSETSLAGAFYTPARQRGDVFFRLAIRKATGGPTDWRELNGALATVDPSMILFWVDSLEDAVHQSLMFQVVPMRLLIVFAIVALFLASLGVYGTTAFAVRARSREVGIRVALGGSRLRIASLIGQEWTLVLLVALVIGGVGATASSRILESLLFDTGMTDPRVLGLAALITAGAVAAAVIVPVRHALQVDPARTLREE